MRAFLNGSVSLLALYPDEQSVDPILSRTSDLMRNYLSDLAFIDTLRVTELALMAGKLKGNNVPELRAQLAEEYPSQEPRMNRELIRILAYLQDPTTAEQVIGVLESDTPAIERLHAGLCARFLTTGWNTPRKLAMLQFFEEARGMPGGHSFAGYIENVSRDFFAGLNEEQRKAVLAGGAKWPTSALSVLARLPEHPSSETLLEIVNLDRQVKRVDSDACPKIADRHRGRLGQQPRPGGHGLSARSLRERARPPRDAGHGAGPTARRRELAAADSLAVDRRRSRGPGNSAQTGRKSIERPTTRKPFGK